MAITAPSLKQISAIGGFDYSSKASQPMKTFCDAVQAEALTASSYQIANNREYVQSVFASASLATAGTTVLSYTFSAQAAATVTAAQFTFSGTPSVAPAAAPNDCVLTVYKNGATVVATTTLVATSAAGTWVAMTLSGTLANKQLAAGDTLTCEVKMNNLCKLGATPGGSGVNFQITMVPKAT